MWVRDNKVWYEAELIENVKAVLNNFDKVFYGSCSNCKYHDCEDDCAKHHLLLIKKELQEWDR